MELLQILIIGIVFVVWTLLYSFLSQKSKKFLLLGTSAFIVGLFNFYFLCGMLMELFLVYRASIMLLTIPTHKKRIVLTVGMASLIGFFLTFRYLLAMSFPSWKILGLSVFTFHMASYLVDIFKGKYSKNPAFLDLLTYGMFFPVIIAGPILRFNDFTRQLEKSEVTKDHVVSGGFYLFLGLFQKFVISDSLSILANAVFDARPTIVDPVPIIVGVYAYSIQIYADFLGYTNIARGVGTTLGFLLPENFSFPYLSTSLRDFWRRWNMSVSSWARDYIYIPLGGNAHGKSKTVINTFLVMIFIGIWHGATPLFLVWGMFHGVLMVLERLMVGSYRALRRRLKIHSSMEFILRVFFTFHVVTLGWIFFRAHSVVQAFEIIGAIGKTMMHPNVVSKAYIYFLFFVAPFLLLEGVNMNAGSNAGLLSLSPWKRVIWYVLILFMITIFGGHIQPFIYARF